ncbi:MaoC/PaaZ C-terminal domain-containing protein [Dactylosporangium sp. NPDC005572]|uniref:MaoC family dehydratase n=1 Tax=Dactylosporangium sp. NPDC005572 TaxID=3156889 RepID=UPI0033AFB1AE
MDVEQLQVGDAIPAFTRATGFPVWNRYAAVNDEFIPIHMDDAAGQEAGFGGAIGMGNLQWAYVHNLLREWIGEDGEVLRVSCQFRRPNLAGQTVTAQGTVTGLEHVGGAAVVDLDVVVADQDGNQLVSGTARVRVPAHVNQPTDDASEVGAAV